MLRKSLYHTQCSSQNRILNVQQCQAAAKAGCSQRETKPGAKHDPSTGGSLCTQGAVPQHLNTAGRKRCWQCNPPAVPDETGDSNMQVDQPEAKRNGYRDSTRHKLQGTSEGPIQETSHLPHRPEIYPGSRAGGRHTYNRAQARTGTPTHA